MASYEILEIKGKWIGIVKQLYTHTTGKIKIANRFTQNLEITKGLKQGCTLSPLLFNIYIDKMVENWEHKCERRGITIEDRELKHLLFADDHIIFIKNKENMTFMIETLKNELMKYGLKININKTEYMCIGGGQQDIHIGDETIRHCQDYKYLGSIISANGSIEEDVNNRVRQGKAATRALHGVLWNNNIRKETKKNIFHSIIESITLYGGEVWPVTESLRNKIRTVELDFLRRCLQITKRERWRTEEIWKEMGITSSITRNLENRTLRWYGHVERMQEHRWPKNIFKWSPGGKRRRGRPCYKWKTHVTNIMVERDLQQGDWEDRERWRLKTTNP